ncbi:DUF3829 domain-containing protein [Selenomonas sp. oral taxon 892]|uniref:DUF3829 domain-containing protein n=1 Tax=Selenomonas sp. oral taxon 892 TaxID=1321785 RepID=UPI00040F98F6|nr:DUF3829 domain-containing protein [Selenomonas sp. oral taxon 892]
MFHPMRRTLSILAVGGLLCAPAVLLTGCFGSDKGDTPAAGVSALLAGNTTEDKIDAISPYLDATNDYNRFIVTFDYAITPSLEEMRSGERMTNVTLPHFTDLKKNLEEARANPQTAGVYPDIDAEADAVLAILKDLAPLADKMESYYSSKGYMADNYAAAAQMTAQYLPLYDAFEPAYDKFDAAVTTHFKEVQLARLEDMRKEGRVNAAAFLELNMKVRELADMLDNENIDKAAAEAKITEINELTAKIPDVPALGSYKSSLNRFIGTFRGYVAGQEDGNEVVEDFNDFVRSSQNLDLAELDNKKK